MATYKYDKYVSRSDKAIFDGTHKPGADTPSSGIYRCLGCGREAVAEKSKKLPPQNHHQQ